MSAKGLLEDLALETRHEHSLVGKLSHEIDIVSAIVLDPRRDYLSGITLKMVLASSPNSSDAVNIFATEAPSS